MNDLALATTQPEAINFGVEQLFTLYQLRSLLSEKAWLQLKRQHNKRALAGYMVQMGSEIYYTSAVLAAFSKDSPYDILAIFLTFWSPRMAKKTFDCICQFETMKWREYFASTRPVEIKLKTPADFFDLNPRLEAFVFLFKAYSRTQGLLPLHARKAFSNGLCRAKNEADALITEMISKHSSNNNDLNWCRLYEYVRDGAVLGKDIRAIFEKERKKMLTARDLEQQHRQVHGIQRSEKEISETEVAGVDEKGASLFQIDKNIAGVEDIASQVEHKETLRAILHDEDPLDVQIFTLGVMAGMSYVEILKELDSPVTTTAAIRARYERLVKRLRKKMTD